MPKIILLDDSTIAKIAAGEVIERPASVVKELLENAIDAGADEITIKIKEGGKKQITIIDNGEGMDKEDLLLCVKKHATSKIKKIEDIFSVLSYGFRGEALATIAEVSKMEIISGQEKSDVAYKLVLEDGKQKEFLPEQKYKGTIVNVYNLFYTIPARQKFLKSDPYEFKRIADWIKSISVANPKIAIKVYNNDKLIFNFSKTDSVEKRILDVFSLTVLSGSYKDPIVDAKVYFTNPTDLQESMSETKQLFYINNRLIHNKTISYAIFKAFEFKAPKGKKPNVFAFLNIPAKVIDVNVHPQKLEVRVKDENTFFYPVYNSLRNALEAGVNAGVEESRTKIISLVESQVKKDESAQFFFSVNAFAQSGKGLEETRNNNKENNYNQSKLGLPFISSTKISSKSDNYKIIGQFDNTFILVEDKNKSLLLIDQHVAEERYNFEKFLQEFDKTKTINAQELIVAMPIDCSNENVGLVEKHKDFFSMFGFDISTLKDSILVRRIPVLLGRIPDKQELQEMILEILLNIEDSEILKSTNVVDARVTKVLTTLACKASIKADTALGFSEMKRIVDNLFMTKNPYTCPHGRPVIIELTNKEIYHKIGRM